MSKLGILVALPAEAKSLIHKTPPPLQKIEIAAQIFLYITGMGSEGIFQAMDEFHRCGVRHIINWGTAGALESDLRCGDIILPTAISSSTCQYQVADDWHQRISRLLKTTNHVISEQCIYTATQMIGTIEERKQLALKKNAIAVDMESSTIARYARNMDMQLGILKVIADHQDYYLPPCIKHIDRYGRPHLCDFSLSVLRSPSQVPHVVRLAIAFRNALHVLTQLGNLLLPLRFSVR